MKAHVRYTTNFKIKDGKIKSSSVIGEESATETQKTVIATLKPLVRQFVQSRLTSHVSDCQVTVHYAESMKGLEITFKA